MHKASSVTLALLSAGLLVGQNLSFASRQARPVSEWLHKTVIYELWLNAFSAEGTLRGAIPGLHRIAELAPP